MYGSSRTAIIRRALTSACIVGSGCVQPPHGVGGPVVGNASTAGESPGSWLFSRPSESGDAVVVVGLRFEVERILVPTASLADKAERVWRFVDELRIDPAQSAFLARNGFRIGTAGEGGVRAIRSALESPETRFERVERAVRAGFPLTITLGRTVGNEEIFHYRSSGSLEGRSYSGAVKYLHIDYEADEADPGRMVLRIVPEIFKESAVPKWHRRGGEIRYGNTYEGTTFHELATEISLGSDESLIVGPARPGSFSGILGQAMLTTAVDGERWAAYYCVKPNTYVRE